MFLVIFGYFENCVMNSNSGICEWNVFWGDGCLVSVVLFWYITFLCLDRKKQTFAPTRPSSVLIEQLAVCVDRGEPVLLVGETGTGKTSTVQYLAHITGKTHLTHDNYYCYSRNCCVIIHCLAFVFSRAPFEGYQYESAEWYCRSARRVSGWLIIV